MFNIIKNHTALIFNALNLNPPTRKIFRNGFPVELGNEHYKYFKHVKNNNLSMGSDQRLFSTMLACKHVIENEIPGDFVECGVWRGGHSILAGLMFSESTLNKKLYLYDTFLGMTAPTSLDIGALDNKSSFEEYKARQKQNFNSWCYASIEDVRKNFDAANIHNSQFRLIQGDVCKTLLNSELLPDKISILRLDTDWYESTFVELNHLYPLLSPGGIIIIDDYGHWKGARKAVEDYFKNLDNPPFLTYIDYTGRMGIKPGRY